MADEKKIALVTGGNKGIGLEISRNLSSAGRTVILGARDRERGQQAVGKLEQGGLGDVHFIEIDVTRQDTITAAAQQIESRYGRLDILMNNAGVNVRGDGLPSAADLGAVQRVFDTNLFGALRVAQAMLPLLHKSAAGRIVNVSGLHSGSDFPSTRSLLKCGFGREIASRSKWNSIPSLRCFESDLSIF
jgi:NAD(P)-dependent dehydrogenase (short-subunit alcohol dehydrogenase family)